MNAVSMHDAKTRLSALVDAVVIAWRIVRDARRHAVERVLGAGGSASSVIIATLSTIARSNSCISAYA